MTFVKFCGMTRDADVDVACELGVNALGFVLWPQSPRHVEMRRLEGLVRRLPPAVLPVGVFVAPDAAAVQAARDAGVRVVQLHGDGGAAVAGERWIARAIDTDFAAVPDDILVVLDAHDPIRHGGTGRIIDWHRAASIASTRRLLLAGGLTPGNVGDAIRQVRPYGVDVASGIEERPGVKSITAMQAFIAAVREADQ